MSKTERYYVKKRIVNDGPGQPTDTLRQQIEKDLKRLVIADIDAAERALAEGDVIKILQAYEKLKTNEG